MRLIDRLSTRSAFDAMSLEQYIAAASGSYYAGPITQTLTSGQAIQAAPETFAGHSGRFVSNPIVFACEQVRVSIFSGARFQFQRMNNGRPSELFGTADLAVLERPWPGGTTQDLLARMIMDADLAGNSYWRRTSAGLERLRPDWVDVVIAPTQTGWRKVGYAYWPNGSRSGTADMVPLQATEVAHFAPMPDPMAEWRGMSWLTPVVREVLADEQMSQHKRAFFTNGATPNMVVKYPKEIPPNRLNEFRREFEAMAEGVGNAYKTLHLGGGVDATVVGADMKQVEFKVVQAAGETRIAAAAGVPAIIVGLSEGLASGTFSNYTQARRRFGDGTLHPLWSNAAGTIGQIIPAPAGARMWYDARDIPFLRDDSKEAAEIQQMQAATMASLVQAGYTPESVSKAVLSGDYGLLQHSGLYSVQLQRPGTSQNPQGGAA